MLIQLEGLQSVEAALQAYQRKFELILIKTGLHSHRIRSLLLEAERQNIPVKYVSREELDRMAQGKTHGGVMALCTPKSKLSVEQFVEILNRSETAAMLLLLEGVEDQQHLGYIFRTAEALGAQAILLKKHLWDFNETAVSRASSGAFERLPLVKISHVDEVAQLKRNDLTLIGCIARSRKTFYQVDLTRPVILAVGGEKRGLSGALRAICDVFVRIPMFSPQATSLSLTHAACLLLGEAARQRYLDDQ